MRVKLQTPRMRVPAYCPPVISNVKFYEIRCDFALRLNRKYAIFSNMTWDIKYHDDKLQLAVLGLPSGILARYFHCTDRMQIFGPDLGMPHTRAMGSGLFELRLKSQEGIGRVFYCTLVGRKIIMLHQFVKKTDKTPPKELAIANKRMKEWKNADT